MSFTGKPALTTAQPIANDGFWDDLSMADLMSRYRIPAEYADDVIKTGLVMAMVRVNEMLFKAKEAVISLGLTSFDAYYESYDTEVNGQNVLFWHYQHAVYCRAKAGLLQQFNSLNRKANAENAALESEDMEQYWLDESQRSIHFIFSVILPDTATMATANTCVELI